MDADIKRMCPQQRARRLTYTEPSKEVKGWTETARQRVRDRLAQERNEKEKNSQRISDSDQERLTGQLKAAEARDRIRQMRLQLERIKAEYSIIKCKNRFYRLCSSAGSKMCFIDVIAP